jgi:two-component system sensor kinase FixL
VSSRAVFSGARKVAPLAVAAIAAAIFVIDLNSNSNVTVSVLYVGVVLLSAGSKHARTILLVSIGCAALTVAALLLSPPGESFKVGVLNDSLSITANAITTALVLRGRSANMQLRERAGLLELSHDAVFTRDMGDVITFWNPAAERLYGWTSEEAIGRIPHDFLETIFPQSIDDIYAELRRTGRWEGELVHKRRDGTEVIVASRWSLHRDRQGQPVAILETNNDITERTRTQESLRQAQSELARYNRILLMGEMTASISHEINQPISGAITNANAAFHWLAAEPPNLEQVRKSLDRIVKDGHRASEVIARVRALAKKTPARMEPLDGNEAVSEVLALTDRELQSNSVKLSVRLLRNLPLVSADRIQIQQVILNLVVNAIEAMSGTPSGRRELVVSTGCDVTEVFVEVRDNGVGLEAADCDRLFQSFYTTKEGGMGMGLSLSRSIIEAHGGRLSAAPNEPDGAVFRFTLPIFEPPTSDQPAPCAQTTSEGLS